MNTEPETTLDATSLEHIFNGVRRQLNEELGGFTHIFIVHNNGTRESVYSTKKSAILEHPCGELILPLLEPLLNAEDAKSICVGAAAITQNALMGFSKKQECLSVSFVNADELGLFEDINFACKHKAYALTWHALSLTNALKNQDEQSAVLEAEKLPIEEQLRHNMLADCFAAILLENEGNKGAIQTIIKKYCELCIAPTAHFKPENFPMPVVVDGLNLIYKDLKNKAAPKTSPIEHALFMTDEIDQTYDDISLRQWASFCQSAQDMAWAERSSNDILSAAVYSNENPYIRATAYIISEALNTNPVPLTHTDFYNPFADFETNERLHLRKCSAAFSELLERVTEEENPELFLNAAKEQTKKLMKGQPIGWCTPALLEAENAYRLSKETRNPEENMVEIAFERGMTGVKWRDVHMMNRLFVSARRQGHSITPEYALEIMSEYKNLAVFKNAFEMLQA